MSDVYFQLDEFVTMQNGMYNPELACMTQRTCSNLKCMLLPLSLCQTESASADFVMVSLFQTKLDQKINV